MKEKLIHAFIFYCNGLVTGLCKKSQLIRTLQLESSLRPNSGSYHYRSEVFTLVSCPKRIYFVGV